MNYHIINIEQGTPEWLNARKGKLTGSKADEVITPTGLLSKSREDLMSDLTTETLVIDPILEERERRLSQKDEIAWGNLYEPEAREVFTKITGYAVETVGMLQSTLHPCLACSPDGLLMIDGEIAFLEIKCPISKTHTRWARKGELPKDHKVQVHYEMAITGIKRSFFMSYYPGLKPLIIPVHWNEYTDKIKAAALAFAAEYEQEMPRILNAIRP